MPIMMLPDFTSDTWRRTSPRAKLHAVRECLVDRARDEPLPIWHLYRLMRWMFEFSIELVNESHQSSKFAMDKAEIERLLRAEIAVYDAAFVGGEATA